MVEALKKSSMKISERLKGNRQRGKEIFPTLKMIKE
jgi:hypothetical protein